MIIDGKIISNSVKEQIKNEVLALKEKGVTPYHRKSYAPVAKLLDEV